MTLRSALSTLPDTGAVHHLRRMKHRAAVLAKHAGWGFPHVRGPITEPFYAAYQRARPYPFPHERYADTWLSSSSAARPVPAGEPVPRRVFVVWSGDNALPPRRAASLSEIRRTHGDDLEVVLVTPHNLADWIVDGSPLAPQYEHLSLVHRSDYLRCYLLHHHGGAYSDVKRPRGPWLPSLLDLETSDRWLLGYTEAHRLLVPVVDPPLGPDLRRVSRQLLGYGGLVARPGTPLTQEWYDRVHTILDRQTDALRRHPGDTRGGNVGYPLEWTEILAQVVAPLTWKYQEHVIHDARVRPVLRGYM